MPEVKIPYGFEVTSARIIHIDEAVRGKACNCICPNCKSPLLARKGPENVNHFAHEGDRICNGYLETLLHKTSKQIIKDANTIRLPSLALYTLNSNGRIRKKYTIVDVSSQFIKYDHCDDEEYIRREDVIIKPDLILKKGERPLIIEIVVTHPIDAKKADKIIKLGCSALEINLSWVGIDFEYKALRNMILNRLNFFSKDQTYISFKKWINNERFNKLANKLRQNGMIVKPDKASGGHPYDDVD